MGIATWIVIGLIAGWLANLILGTRGGPVHNLAIGLIGAVVGGLLFRHISTDHYPSFFGSLLTATVGAVILLVIWRAIRRG
jgi:uncharacterized membrane protein YeaQ/YmgE (transglycosylase-associated protein family)